MTCDSRKKKKKKMSREEFDPWVLHTSDILTIAGTVAIHTGSVHPDEDQLLLKKTPRINTYNSSSPLVISKPVQSVPSHGFQEQEVARLGAAYAEDQGLRGRPILDAKGRSWSLVRQLDVNRGSVRQQPTGYPYQQVLLVAATIEPNVRVLGSSVWYYAVFGGANRRFG